MIKRISLLVFVLTVAACGGDTRFTTEPPPAATGLLKDIVASNLPSPFYHFEYDASGKITRASYASDLYVYDLTYRGDKLSEMRNNILVNHDRLVYNSDDAGRVVSVRYVDANGVTFTLVLF